jgi:hypothetical protein
VSYVVVGVELEVACELIGEFTVLAAFVKYGAKSH